MSDMVEQATKIMHAEVCCPCDPQGCNWTRVREVRYARALADAGLLAQPTPEPDWLDAPAVLAAMNECSWQKVWLPSTTGYWTCTCCGTVKHWTNMADVTPLYPKGK